MRRQTYIVGNLTIDHTFLPNSGQEHIVFGGNALYAAIGSRLWGQATSIVSCFGHDYPQAYISALSKASIGVEWLLERSEPSLRGRLTYELDGSRIWQSMLTADQDTENPSHDAVQQQHRRFSPHPTPELLEILKYAAGVHLAPMPSDLQKAFINGLMDSSAYLSLDPHPMLIEELKISKAPELQRVNAFLPSWEEAALLYDLPPISISPTEAIDIAKSLSSLGPSVVAVKLGSQGVAVYERATNNGFHLPAKQVEVVDSTGAGDSFCGAWLATASRGMSEMVAAERGINTAAKVVMTLGVVSILEEIASSRTLE